MCLVSSAWLTSVNIMTFHTKIIVRQNTGMLQGGYMDSKDSSMFSGKSLNLHDCYVEISKFVEGSETANCLDLKSGYFHCYTVLTE